MRFASDPDACWATINATSSHDSSDCSSLTPISTTITYYLHRDITTNFFQWSLKPTTTSNTGVVYQYAVDSSHNIYLQKGTGSSYTATIYTRKLSFSNYTDPDSFDLTVTVTWTESNK